MLLRLSLTVRVSAGHLVGKENSGRHPREDHDEQRQELQVPGEDTGALGVTEVLILIRQSEAGCHSCYLLSLLARALCTMTWSLHQYQILEIARPNVIPDQGRSEL